MITAATPGSQKRRRRAGESITDAFAKLMAEPEPGAPAAAVTSTPADLAAVRGVFEEVAAVHVAQVRNVMLELRFGGVESSWVESSRPALRSLREMAARMELAELVTALDQFCATVDATLAVAGSQIEGDRKDELLARYTRLIELIPSAFELDGERDRREPIIVESLLRQVEGVEKVTIDKLFAAGLNRLETLFAASAEEMAVVCGIRTTLAEAIVARLRAFRAGAGATFSAADAAAEHKELRDLLAALRTHHDDFERAAAGWSDEAREDKKRARKQREDTFNRIKVALARLGERDVIAQLEKQTFQDRIRTIETHLAALSRARQASQADRGPSPREERPWQS